MNKYKVVLTKEKQLFYHGKVVKMVLKEQQIYNFAFLTDVWTHQLNNNTFHVLDLSISAVFFLRQFCILEPTESHWKDVKDRNKQGKLTQWIYHIVDVVC